VPIATPHLELDNEKPRQPRAYRLRQPVLAVEIDQDDEHAKRRSHLIDKVERHHLRHGGQEDGLRNVSVRCCQSPVRLRWWHTLDGIFWLTTGSGLAACVAGATVSAFRAAGVALAGASIRADWAANERAWKARASGGERSSGRRREADMVLADER
jgi:hypothetical protein